MLKFFRLPFATTGDKTAVPDAVDSNGNVSYSQGYGFDYQRQKTDPAAKNIERDKMNQVFFDITTAIAELQSQGIPDYITPALNGGSAYSYSQNAIVKYSGAVYISLVAANTALPSDATKWALLATPALLQQAANYSAVAGGTVNALTAAFTPAIASLPAAPGTLSLLVRAAGANTTATPTFAADATAAKTIVKGNNLPLAAGDIAGAGMWLELQYDATLDKWVLQNPATGVAGVTSANLQSQTYTAFTTGGVSGAFTLTPSPALTSYAAGQRFRVKFSAAGNGSDTINVSALGAKNLKQYDSGGNKVAPVIASGCLFDVEYDGVDFVILDPLPSAVATVGATRNAKMSVTAASASGTFTADEIVVETALGGTAYRLASYSQAINLATTGAGGMDTGAAPVSGFVSLYAIYNPATNTKNILACNVTTSSGSVYSGANMPAGYTASALIGIWPTNASSQFVPGLIADPLGRKFQYQTYVAIFTNKAATAALTSQSVSAGAPAAAKAASYIAKSGPGNSGVPMIVLSADATGVGGRMAFAGGNASTIATLIGGMASASLGMNCLDVPFLTAQTVYFACPNNTVTDLYMHDFSW